MIPLRLELTNFLSYRDTAVLDFNGIHLACISGANGAGKSSILDGITWALFGKARSKSDDDLINRRAVLEDAAAEVAYTFALEESTYRIIRRKKARKGTKLELQILTDGSPEAGKWKALSETKIRETEAAIQDLLRMDYDTFINASFLLQGKADEFTTKTPGKRKEVLADLLGVSQWDVYREAAAEKRKAAETRITLLDGQLDDIAAELAEEEARKAALDAAKAAQTAVAERLADKEALLAQLRRVETAVQQQQTLVKNLGANLSRAQTTLTGLDEKVAQRRQERDEYETILAQAEAITAAFAAYEKAAAGAQAWQAKADRFHQLTQAKHHHDLTITQERSRLTSRQQELETQQTQRETAETERETVQQTLESSQARLAEIQAELVQAGQQAEAWREARQEVVRLESERKNVEKERARLQKEAAAAAKLAAEQTAVARNQTIAQESLDKAAAELAALAEKNERFLTARAELDSLAAEQPRLREQMNKLRERIDKLEVETGGDCPLCGQELSENHRLAVLDELKVEGKASADRFRANQQRIKQLTEETAVLQQQLKQRPRLEREQKTQRDRLARAEARLAEIAQKQAEWETGGQKQLAEIEAQWADTAVLEAKKQEAAALSAAAGQKEALEKEQRTQQQAIAKAEARLAEIGRLAAEWEAKGAPELAAVTTRLAEGEYAVEAQTAAADIDRQLAELGYDAAAHAAAKTALAELAEAPRQDQALRQAQAAVKPLEAALADLETQRTQQQEVVSDLQAQRETAVTQLADLQAGSGDLQAVDNEVMDLRDKRISADRAVGAAQQRLSVLDDQRQRRRRLEEDRATETLLVQRLKLLEKSCGRDGVQALLIEHALPEIEEQANALLDRLTGGDMRVTFATQRKLKSRDAIKETLDIQISDSAGERPYDNYSGGEQFRVNFAIRLALSRLLAKRAGARLQTLVVDEGFGSQDPNGRQRLVEAINTIQNDFARILIITHIDELRDAFPTRIEVSKTAAGSSIVVV